MRLGVCAPTDDALVVDADAVLGDGDDVDYGQVIAAADVEPAVGHGDEHRGGVVQPDVELDPKAGAAVIVLHVVEVVAAAVIDALQERVRERQALGGTVFVPFVVRPDAVEEAMVVVAAISTW